MLLSLQLELLKALIIMLTFPVDKLHEREKNP